MKKLLQYSPFHFLSCLIIGIILQFYTNIWRYDFNFLIVFMFSFLLLLFLLKRNNKRKLFSIVTLLFFIVVGVSTSLIHNSKNNDNYYQRHINDNSGVIVKIRKVLKSGNYNRKFIADVIQVDTKITSGTILLNLKKDSISRVLNVDDRIFLKSEFKNLADPLNPYQFNYKDYLVKQYIYQQIFIQKKDYKRLEKGTVSIYGLSAQFRNKVQTSLKKHSFSKDELSVINALLLGQRQDISKNLLESYINAGAVHILAISGLHIGIILLVLSSLFKPLERLKHGVIIKAVLIVILLWMFAFIAGLSASVVRAVTMFTFIAVGASFKKKRIVEYSLISSMFFLLLIKPLFLFDVGFQLSYLAVFGIIWVQPLLYKLWKPKIWLLDKIWSLITVSLAAQVGILPISLYYFHQFPGLFIISNILIIPFLGGILIGGILVILLALLNLLPQIFVDIYGFVISLMNKIVDWVSNQEGFLWQEISMSFYEMFGWYFIIVFAYQFVIIKKTTQLLFLLASIVMLQTVFIFEKKNRHQKQEIIVFNKSRKNMLGKRNGKQLHVFHNLDSLKTTTDKAIIDYRINENINSYFINKTPNYFKFNSDNILIIDSLGVYNIAIKNPIVLLQHSPKINLTRLIKTLKPKKIIADGSNYRSYINRWKLTCKKQKTPFHHTGQNGAYILK
ncbi:ComEC/Rec2 family competence protein [Tenacibaculum sp. HL-MS23]|uniref:ComEC/Rec2 family competence protein n=1 Tax=Tenacibaculum sp. HL-MS23 TaxID=3077734 RepID=UPI0028FC2845|nr:ComEC/Rec2 family competence protein [Tenacibaculum sp. HL-MS23]WNW01596.1 ComEC/Rec2 family competence protein [Tenacibaculum sp. HL-MS23]